MERTLQIRDVVSDAITYWEPRQVVYNIVLALIVLVCCSFSCCRSSRTLVLFVVGTIFPTIISRCFAMGFFTPARVGS